MSSTDNDTNKQIKKVIVRNSGIELLKVFGIILVIFSHVLNTLSLENNFISHSNDYLVNLNNATTDIQLLVLSLLQYSGIFGNAIFFICSAWFLLDSNKVSKKSGFFC